MTLPQIESENVRIRVNWLIVPRLRLFAVADVERVFGMTCLCQAKVGQGFWLRKQELFDCEPLVQMVPVCAPSGDNVVSPFCTRNERLIVVGSNGVFGFAHGKGIGITPREDICHPKCAIAQSAGAPFAAFYGWIVGNFVCFGGDTP